MKNKITVQCRIRCVPDGMRIKRNTYHFYVPVGAVERVLKDFTKDGERFAALRVLSIIQILQIKNGEFEDNEFVPISRETFRLTAGSNYNKFLDYFIHDNQLIEPFLSDKTGNFSYSTGGECKAFCKKYRFTKKHQFEVIVWEQSKLISDGLIDGNLVFTPKSKHDAELLYCLNFERKLSLDESAIDEIDDEWTGYYSYMCERINNGNFIPATQDESTRFYFNSVVLKNQFKKYLRYDGKDNLVNFDITCAYPSFLMEKIYNNQTGGRGGGGEEGGHMCPSNKSDFYSIIGDGLSLNRDILKIEFGKYINLKKSIKIKHPFTALLRKRGFTEMADFICKKEEVWRELEDVETELLCRLIRECITLGIPLIRQHDGFLCLKENIEQLNAMIVVLLKDYKYIKFKSSPLSEEDSTRKRTTIIATEYMPRAKGHERKMLLEFTLWFLKKIRNEKRRNGEDVSDHQCAISSVNKNIEVLELQIRKEELDNATQYDDFFVMA